MQTVTTCDDVLVIRWGPLEWQCFDGLARLVVTATGRVVGARAIARA